MGWPQESLPCSPWNGNPDFSRHCGLYQYILINAQESLKAVRLYVYQFDRLLGWSAENHPPKNNLTFFRHLGVHEISRNSPEMSALLKKRNEFILHYHRIAAIWVIFFHIEFSWSIHSILLGCQPVIGNFVYIPCRLEGGSPLQPPGVHGGWFALGRPLWYLDADRAHGGWCALEKNGLSEGGSLKGGTLQGTNISPKMAYLKIIFLFPRWDMLISLEGRCFFFFFRKNLQHFVQSSIRPIQVFWIVLVWIYFSFYTRVVKVKF